MNNTTLILLNKILYLEGKNGNRTTVAFRVSDNGTPWEEPDLLVRNGEYTYVIPYTFINDETLIDCYSYLNARIQKECGMLD